MPTIHNPSQFNPEDYVVVDYFDNRPPRIPAGHKKEDMATKLSVLAELEDALGLEHFEADLDMDALKSDERTDAPYVAWRAQRDDLFPTGAYKCVHCGCTNVRFVVSCLHRPTNTRACFGDICVNRLEFANHDEFKAARLRKVAAIEAARLAGIRKVARAVEGFIQQHPEVIGWARQLQLPVHANNSFARDVLRRFYQYGFMSNSQLNAVAASLRRDVEWASRRAAEAVTPTAPAPDGRVAATGVVVSVKQYDTYFGLVCKMLVKLDTGAKVFCTRPTTSTGENILAGDTVTVVATWSRKQDDQFFAYGQRPRLVSFTRPTAAA